MEGLASKSPSTWTWQAVPAAGSPGKVPVETLLGTPTSPSTCLFLPSLLHGAAEVP
jgi:hypothetical protein